MFNRNNQNNQNSSVDDKADDKKNQDGAGGKDKKDKEAKAPKKNLTRVKFNKAHTPYLKGEIAGVELDLAKKLIEAKICSKA
jgi:hypothetical protein